MDNDPMMAERQRCEDIARSEKMLDEKTLPDPLHDPLLDQPVGRVTLRDFLNMLARHNAEEAELAKTLRGLNTAINALETTISPNPGGKPEAERQMARLKNLRETFNRIAPKWFHP
jgi:hypothetical protein